MISGRRSKLVLFLLGVPLVLIGAIIIALKVYFTEERLKQYILPRIEEATHRTATLDRISLSLLPSIAINIEGLTISNRHEPGFSTTPMFSVQQMLLDIDLRALLSGDIHITMVSIQNPKIRLEVNTLGIKNYAMNEGPTPLQSETGGTALAGGILLAEVQMTDGILEYINHKDNSATVLRGTDYGFHMEGADHLQRITVVGNASVDNFSYGSVSSPLVSGLHLAVEHVLEYSRTSDSLIITKGAGALNGMPLTLSGTIAGATSDAPFFNIHIGGDNLNITDLLALIPPEYMKSAKGVEGEGKADIRLQAIGFLTDSTRPAVRGQISAAHARVQFTGLRSPISDINIAAEFERSASVQRIVVKQFSAILGEDLLQATMSLYNFDDPTLSATVNGTINLAKLDNYYPVDPGIPLSGSVRAGVTLNGKVRQPSEMTGTGSLEFRDVTLGAPKQSGSLRHLNGTVTVNNTVLQTNNLAMTLGESDLSLSFSIRNYVALLSNHGEGIVPTATVALTSRHLRTKDIIPVDSSKTPVSGKPGKASGKPAIPFPPLTMDVTAAINTLSMEKLTLENVRGNLHIAGGAVTLNSFSCNSFGGNIRSTGKLGLEDLDHPAFSLSLDLSNVESHSLLSEFTSFGSRMFGKLSLQATMSGSTDDTLGLNTASLNGQGTIQIDNGRLIGIKINKEIASRLSLPSLEEIPFTHWSNGFAIRNGRILIRDLAIKGSDGEYVVNGSQGFDGSLDYELGVTLPLQASGRLNVAGFVGDALSVFKEPDGRFHFDFRVTGTNDNPTVALRTETARARLEEMATQKVAEEKKKLEDQLKKKGEDLLNKFIKKK